MNGELHRGKLAKAPVITSVRPLTREDLAVLRERRPAPPPIKQFREAHHRLARLLAAGLRDEQVAELTGYSISRVGSFKSNPAGADLIAAYRPKVDAAEIVQIDEMRVTMRSNMLSGEKQLEALLDAADEAGEQLPAKFLNSFVMDRADRMGYGKISTNVNVNVGSAAALEQAIVRSGKATVIEGKASHPAKPSPEEGWSRSQPPAQVPAIRRRV